MKPLDTTHVTLQDALDEVVFPGDILTHDHSKQRVLIGTGLQQHSVKLANGEDTPAAKVTKVGVLRNGPLVNRFRVETQQRRYIPRADERVIGTVVGTLGGGPSGAGYYRVDIKGPKQALLSKIAFEGASKANRPNIKHGALVYCRVLTADRDMEPELTCKSKQFKKQWSTGEGVFAELIAGYCFDVSLQWARELQKSDSHVLNVLGSPEELAIPFEITIAQNGRVWVNSHSITQTTLICNCITNAEFMSDEHTTAMCQTLVHHFT